MAVERNLTSDKVDQDFGNSHGCLPPARLKNELLLGVDRLSQIFRADADNKLMALFLWHFRHWGDTLEQVFLGTRAFGTIDPRNLEAMLSTQFSGKMTRFALSLSHIEHVYKTSASDPAVISSTLCSGTVSLRRTVRPGNTPANFLNHNLLATSIEIWIFSENMWTTSFRVSPMTESQLISSRCSLGLPWTRQLRSCLESLYIA